MGSPLRRSPRDGESPQLGESRRVPQDAKSPDMGPRVTGSPQTLLWLYFVCVDFRRESRRVPQDAKSPDMGPRVTGSPQTLLWLYLFAWTFDVTIIAIDVKYVICFTSH